MNSEVQEKLTTKYVGGADLVVIGGGPGGVTAAVAAARHGLKVLIIEKGVFLGGLSTGGHVCLFESLCDGKGKKVTAGMAEEFLYLSIKYSYNSLPKYWGKDIIHANEDKSQLNKWQKLLQGRYNTLYNVPAYALAMEELVLAENIEILYDSVFCEPVIENKQCVGVIVENMDGRVAYRCKMVVDGSGSSVVFAKAGVKCVNHENILSFECYDTDFEMMKYAMETNDMVNAVNWRYVGADPLNPKIDPKKKYYGDTAAGINEYILDSHAAALGFLKKNQRPDYAMLSLPTMPQIRMIRRIVGCEEMKEENDHKTVKESIGCVSDWRKAGPAFEVPYRCMLTDDLRNVFAVGRNISADDRLWDIMRCYPGAMTTGQAAGTASALALELGVDPADVPVDKLQKTLETDGVFIHETK